MDRYIWDGLVRAVGGVGQFFGILNERFRRTRHQRRSGRRRDRHARARAFHVHAASGQIQTYLGVVAVGMLALLILYAWLT